jgi:hypothetical protein
MLDDGIYTTVSDVGDAENISKSYVSRILRLALLAPDIVEAIVAGKTDQALMLEQLERPLPANWEEQQKTDRNDARGIAQMIRVGLFRPVHVKTLQSQQRRMLLTTRKLLQSKMLDLENDLRGTLKNFGFKVGKIGAAGFEARVRELVDGYPTLRAMVIPVLVARAALREQFKVLHALLLRLVRHDRACRLLMTAPGVGPVAAMTFRATVDVPARFRKSKARRRPFRPDAAQASIGRDGSNRADLETRRSHGANRAVRSRAGRDDPADQMVHPQGVGHEDRSQAWAPPSHRRGRPPPRRHPPSHVGQRNSVPVGTTSHCMKQRAAAEAAALRAPPQGGGVSLAGDDGKGKSALCGANPAGLPTARRRRPEELAFSVARIEKPQRKLGGGERFRAARASSRCIAVLEKRPNSWAFQD